MNVVCREHFPCLFPDQWNFHVQKLDFDLLIRGGEHLLVPRLPTLLARTPPLLPRQVLVYASRADLLAALPPPVPPPRRILRVFEIVHPLVYLHYLVWRVFAVVLRLVVPREYLLITLAYSSQYVSPSLQSYHLQIPVVSATHIRVLPPR